MNDATEPSVGHNRPPPYSAETLDDYRARCERATAQTEEWLKAQIASDEAAEQLNDFLGKITALRSAVEKQRKADKQPHLDAGTAVDAAWVPLRDRLERLAKRINPLLKAWWDKKEAERLERVRKAREEAEAAEREAQRQEELARKAKSIEAEEAAEARRKEAERLAKTAERQEKQRTTIASASGGRRAASARTRRVAVLTDINQAFLHFRGHPDVAETLTRLANAAVRAKDGPAEIPGFEICTEQIIA